MKSTQNTPTPVPTDRRFGLGEDIHQRSPGVRFRSVRVEIFFVCMGFLFFVQAGIVFWATSFAQGLIYCDTLQFDGGLLLRILERF